ncbi:hypothetical protein BsIDN1_03850 [Bacillus safensis]|uniref:Uncharacterized protein n=1 Tax=Bacillus safensis TaxID=561879 RepID=A0A5S9LZF1_BACIA|nr:hypothetical protein BsIDN1_03850 [Bacillus safensis]
MLLPTSAQIQDPKKVKAAIEHMRSQKLIFSTWVDHRLLHPDWADLLKEYHLQEVERNTIMMLEHTGDIDPVTSSSLTIKEVLDEQTLFDYTHIFIELFKGSTEAAALEDYFQRFSIKNYTQKLACSWDMNTISRSQQAYYSRQTTATVFMMS